MADKKKTTIDLIARKGLIGKGVVYFMVGLLAFQTFIGMGSSESSFTQAFRELIYQPLGSVLLITCILVGLLAHVFRRILQVFSDPVDRGNNLKNLLFRFIDFIIGCLYLSFSYAAWQIFQGLNTQNSSESTEVWIGKTLTLPFGKWPVLLCVLVVMIIAFYQFYSAYKANFDYRFDTTNMDEKKQKTLRQMGRIGFSAWGVVYVMVGILFYQAAITYNPRGAERCPQRPAAATLRHLDFSHHGNGLLI